jgi:lipoprotein-anchoring transpeptidase ErfK/SrfK
MSNIGRVMVLLAAGAVVSIDAMLDRAAAQACDERYAVSCQRYGGPPPSSYPQYQSYPQYGPQYAPQYRPQYNQPYQPYQPYQSYQPYQRPVAPYPQQGAPSPAPPPRDAYVDPSLRQEFGAIYAAVGGEPFPVPAVPLSYVDPQFLRRTVSYQTSEAPGTIVVDPQNHFLYLIEGGGRAVRYGVGVGRQGFGWSGVANVHDKQQWPDWYPPKEMLQRQPELMRQMSELQSGLGMAGGPRNPLGVRAMYLWQGDKDTLYRIHGTVEPWTIGKSVSSGCIRMINQDVMDLYARTAIGTKVIVLPSREARLN